MSLAKALRQTLLELELLSQVSAAQLGKSSKSASGDIGGNCPPGGLDKDAEHDMDRDGNVIPIMWKSVDHFRERAEAAETEDELADVLGDALSALKAWKTPRRWKEGDPELEFGSTQWKRHVAESNESLGKLASHWGCSRQYISQVRKAYRMEAS